MRKYVRKGRAEGIITVPGSKSMAHRLLISAAMCNEKLSVIHGITPSDDVLATIDCLRVLGVKIEYNNNCAKVLGIDFTKATPSESLNCRESGSTLRFLIPIAALCGIKVEFVGSKRLFERPLDVYEELGLIREKKEDSLMVSGRLCAGEYRVSGGVSSQFISGLIFALSTLPEDSRIVIEGSIESRPYIDLTIATLKNPRWENERTILVPGGKEACYGEFVVEGDWSSAAFIEALNYIGGRVDVLGLDECSLQGDRIFRKLFSAIDGGFCEINLENCPDLGPILFTLAAIKHGARFTGTKRLKDKESDRALAMKTELQKFGAELIIEENSVTVTPCELHAPTDTLYGHNDHRVVMALAVLCTLFGGEIEGCEAVNKSYPDFFTVLETLQN